MTYANQSLKPEIFGCMFCQKLKEITEAVDVDFAQLNPHWNTTVVQGVMVEVKNGPPDFWRREKTPMLVCAECAP